MWPYPILPQNGVESSYFKVDGLGRNAFGQLVPATVKLQGVNSLPGEPDLPPLPRASGAPPTTPTIACCSGAPWWSAGADPAL